MGMPVLPPCTVECPPGCICFMDRCFCPPEVMGEMDFSLGDLFKILSCATDAVGSVKSKACKKSCLMEDSDLTSCSGCVVSKTDCLAAVLATGGTRVRSAKHSQRRIL